MITEIGITAGNILRYLEDHGKSSLSKIVVGIAAEQDRALMSIGWLAREGYVIVEKTGLNYEITLR